MNQRYQWSMILLEQKNKVESKTMDSEAGNCCSHSLQSADIAPGDHLVDHCSAADRWIIIVSSPAISVLYTKVHTVW